MLTSPSPPALESPVRRMAPPEVAEPLSLAEALEPPVDRRVFLDFEAPPLRVVLQHAEAPPVAATTAPPIPFSVPTDPASYVDGVARVPIAELPTDPGYYEITPVRKRQFLVLRQFQRTAHFHQQEDLCELKECGIRDSVLECGLADRFVGHAKSRS